MRLSISFEIRLVNPEAKANHLQQREEKLNYDMLTIFNMKLILILRVVSFAPSV